LAFAQHNIAYCQDYIVWNEFNVADTCFTQHFPASNPGDLLDEYNADHFVAVLHECFTRFTADGSGVEDALLYWGGVDLPPGQASITNLMKYVNEVYAARARRGIPFPWNGGLNIHIHQRREPSDAQPDAELPIDPTEADFMSPLFSRVHQAMENNGDVDYVSFGIIAGEVAVSLEFQCDDLSSRDDVVDLIQGVYDARPIFPDVMFFYSHALSPEGPIGTYGLVEAGPPEQGVPGQPAVLVPGWATVLYESFTVALDSGLHLSVQPASPQHLPRDSRGCDG